MPNPKVDNKHRMSLPENPAPVGFYSLCVAIPAHPDFAAAFYGSLYRLARQSTYNRDENKTARIVAETWLQAIEATINGGVDVW